MAAGGLRALIGLGEGGARFGGTRTQGGRGGCPSCDAATLGPRDVFFDLPSWRRRVCQRHSASVQQMWAAISCPVGCPSCGREGEREVSRGGSTSEQAACPSVCAKPSSPPLAQEKEVGETWSRGEETWAVCRIGRAKP